MKIYRGQDLINEYNRRKARYTSEVKKEVRNDNTTVSDIETVVLKERDFVDEVRQHYIEDCGDTILIVSGLRSTGKTFGLLQAVENHLSETLYITADFNEADKTAQDYISELRDASEKYIIIDEYSWIKDRESLDKALYSFVNHPNIEDRKRIIITGTDSVTLDSLNKGGLIHRAVYKNVNFFSYQEFCRVYYKKYNTESSNEYIEKGGIFLEDAIKDYNDMRNYVQSAVIENLSNSIQMDKSKAKAIVYEIIYQAVCPSDENKVRLPKANNIHYQAVLERAGIDSAMRFSKADLQIVGDALIKTGFVVKTYNFADVKKGMPLEECRFRYNLTNPSIAYQMLKTFFDDVSAVRRFGMVFEANIVAHLYNRLLDQDELYYIDLREMPALGNPELEIVVVNHAERKVYLMDAKKQEDYDLNYGQSLISQQLEDYFSCYSVAGRYVICNVPKDQCLSVHGKKVIFTNLESNLLENYDFFEDNCILANNSKNARSDRNVSVPPM